ncbi:hypothetical protein [Caballeronia terrestris]|nr:hypothetical protein [Caballeronia terrestris]
MDHKAQAVAWRGRLSKRLVCDSAREINNKITDDAGLLLSGWRL